MPSPARLPPSLLLGGAVVCGLVAAGVDAFVTITGETYAQAALLLLAVPFGFALLLAALLRERLASPRHAVLFVAAVGALATVVEVSVVLAADEFDPTVALVSAAGAALLYAGRRLVDAAA
ncbi:hypothetical protein [Halomarina ordinaria]|uniref:Uncharacterized protein n=1 Tax=Halomarina ordinaria TaxID=3033939 RepID=A0ABD5UC65_9EURY|nr:hypothetical protein [Halomarina sp. PSRA2]